MDPKENTLSTPHEPVDRTAYVVELERKLVEASELLVSVLVYIQTHTMHADNGQPECEGCYVAERIAMYLEENKEHKKG